MKVILIAYACDAEDVSETWCSYQWTRHLSELHDATVLVCNRESRRGVAQRQLPNARVIEWTIPRTFERLGAFSHAFKPGYLHFYLEARWLLRWLLRRESFDLIHQYEPFAPRYPSPAAGLGVPFILGPVGGGVEAPAAFRSEISNSMPWFTQLRQLDRFRFRRDPWLRHSYASADLVLGIAPYVQEMLAPVPLRRFEFMHETGVDAVAAGSARKATRRGTLRLLYAGRIVRTKGVRDAIRALAHLTDLPEVTLDIVGDGDDRHSCEREALELGVASRVRFHGWRAAGELAEFYAHADAFVFPSLQEASGTVVIEAMSHGLPVITVAHGGPGFTIDSTCGLVVAAQRPDQFARDLSVAFRELAEKPARLSSLSAGAVARVERDFLWPTKAQRMTKLYHEVVWASRHAAEVRDAA